MRSILLSSLALSIVALVGCEEPETEEQVCDALPTEVADLADAVSDQLLELLPPLEGVDTATVAVTTLNTPSGTLGVVARDTGSGTEYVCVRDASAPRTAMFDGEEISVPEGGVFGIELLTPVEGPRFVTEVSSYDAEGNKVDSWMAERDISLENRGDPTGSAMRLESVGGGGTRTQVTAKYGDILIDGVPLEFD